MVDAVIFDLDDTLYLEREFVASGFRAAASWFRCQHGLDGLEEACHALFEAGHRTKVFDDAVLTLLGQATPAIVASLVEVYRSHVPDIKLAPDAVRYLSCRPNHLHGLLTDGLAATQRAKIKALGVEKFVHCIVCTGEWGRAFWKPHARGFEHMETQFRSGNLAYVADNPTKDFITPKKRGWLTVQIARPERIHLAKPIDAEHEAHIVIQSFDELEGALMR